MPTDEVRPGSPPRDALRVTAAGAGFLVQSMFLFATTSGLVESSNISADCGYDGTCTEAGVGRAVVTVELGVLAAELVLGLLWWALPLWRRRRSPGVEEWWDLVAVRLPWVFIAGGPGSLLFGLAVALFR